MHCQLKVTEIFASIQGESSFAGFPCSFIRLAGCPRRCLWCDTTYAYEEGELTSLEEIIRRIDLLKIRLVMVTGGEPLVQEATPALIDLLKKRKYEVMVETSGTVPVTAIRDKAHIIMDLKCPGSGMMEFNDWSNLDILRPTDEIKFIIADRTDFDWAAAVIARLDLTTRFQVLFSCAFGLLQPSKLAAWLLASGIAGRMQLQIHKYIWDPKARRV